MFKPIFYDPTKIGTVYQVRFPEIFSEAAKIELAPAVKDKKRVALLAIDMQVDFCHKDIGSLYVPGAEKDIQRTIEFLFNNIDKITSCFSSLDTHIIYQIFYKTWWVKEDGSYVDAFTMITSEDIKNGKYRALIDPVWSLDYVKKLEDQTQKPLMVWPFHTMLGTVGHIMDPSLYEAFYFHAAARKHQLTLLSKGIIPQTEMYGILSPEVQVPKHPMGGFNTSFLKLMTGHDILFIVGQAKSHCVLETIRQIHDYFQNDLSVLEKVYILEDCMSSVQHPDVDFEAIAQTEFAKFKKSGMNIIKSTDVDFL